MGALQWFEIFIGAYVLWVLVVSVPLLLARRSPTATLAWIFAFIAIPFFSGVYYMMFGPRRLQRRRRRYTVARGSVPRGIAGEDDGAGRPALAPDSSGHVGGGEARAGTAGPPVPPRGPAHAPEPRLAPAPARAPL